MTVFIASLFLPRTVRFNLPNPSGRSSNSHSRQGTGQGIGLSAREHSFHDSRDRQPSLFQSHPSITPPKTPVGDKVLPDDDPFANEDGFRAQFPPANSTGPSGTASPTRAGPHSSLATAEVAFEDDSSFPALPIDRQSPTWGGRADQPMSRASSPPPSGLIDDKRAIDFKAREMARQGITQPRASDRTDSSERVFAQASWKVVRADHGNGGLRNAVAAAARDGRLGHHMWVGTLGMPTDALGEQRKEDIEARLATEYDMLTVFCSDDDINNHYSHFCKKILWPVFHYQMPDRPKNKAYEDNSWKDYVRVNQAFADVIIKNWKRGDSVWVHDYHLLLLPGMIRKKLPEAKIGFFMHVPFPSSELFRCLAVRKELLEGILGANLVGFQIHEYARHFMQTCSRLLSAEAVTEGRQLGLQLEDHYVDVISSPIGIDPVSLNTHREEEAVADWMTKMRNTYGDYKLIVARDKLDHLRGVRQKLLSYELFLNKNPEWRNRTVLIQVALSTSEKTELDATVSDIVTRVNSSWATLTYQPVVYLKKDIDYAQYLALLSLADALMITSQREGMNLTSHEYLSCQDGRHSEKRHGSLILSEFTGTSSLFDGNELSVNPWDYRACADAIKTALEMSPGEKERRWASLQDIVNSHTGAEWLGGLCDELDRAYDHQASHDQISVPRLSTTALVQQYRRASKRLFVLDYEGTLVNWGPLDKIIPVSPQRTLDVLNDLLLDDRNMIYVMSGRRPEELEQLFRQVPGLGLIAENGCFLREFSGGGSDNGSKPWIEMADMEEMRRWKESVKGMMQYFVERTDGCGIEERRCSLLFHYRGADDPEHAARQASDCASNVNDAFETGGHVQHEDIGSGSDGGIGSNSISGGGSSGSGGHGGGESGSSGNDHDNSVHEQPSVHAVAVEGCIIVEPVRWTKTTAAEKVFCDLKANNTLTQEGAQQKGDQPIDFMMVVGDGREDEKVFKWANAMAEEGEVKDVVTVSLGSRNTEAKATLTQGVSGVLSALQRLAASSS